MYLSLEGTASLSALCQAPGNGAGVSHKCTLQWMYIHIQYKYAHANTGVHIPVRVHKYIHVHSYAYMEAKTHMNTHSPTCQWTTPEAVSSVQSCMCVFEYLKDSCRSPPLRSLCSPKLREAEEKGFASSPLAAEMTAMLWRVLLMWDLSG